MAPVDAMSSYVDAVQCCSACGLPPRKINNGKPKPLKRCSRCQNAWYHDANCQRTHFLLHKKECHLLAANETDNIIPVQSSAITVASQQNNRKLKVQRKEGRGNCLVSESSIRRGERIQDASSDSSLWKPLVPPVLHEDGRSNRCAYCFQHLRAQFYRYEEIKPRPEYLLLFCSTTCRERGRERSLDWEEAAIGQVYERQGPPRIFSTVVLLFRVLVSIQSKDAMGRKVNDQLKKLQCNMPSEYQTDSDNPSKNHTQAVIATVVAMIQVSKQFSLSLPPLEELTDMVSRIKINGFSICDGESVAMGVGLYGTPSFMNHSCLPNAIQTFQYGREEPPTLLVTAVDDIIPNQDICISYIDNSCPQHVRRQRLQNDYFFWCSCQGCEDRARESRIIGIKCLQCNSEATATLLESLAPAPSVYSCANCDNKDFRLQLKVLQNFENPSSSSSVSSLGEMERTYQSLKDICFGGSWYVQEAGELLLQALLDLLARQSDKPVDQQKTAYHAVGILDDLIGCDVVSSSSGTFRRSILSYKGAKLRLFLQPDPRQAIRELESVVQFFSNYYPKDHELIVGLEACLRGAMV